MTAGATTNLSPQVEFLSSRARATKECSGLIVEFSQPFNWMVAVAVLGDKMNLTVRLGKLFYESSTALMYLPCCPVPNCLGKQGELSENYLPNRQVHFIT